MAYYKSNRVGGKVMEDILENNSLLKEYINNNKQFFNHSLPIKTDLEIVKTMHLYEQERKFRPTVLFDNVVDYNRKPVLMNPFKKEIMYKAISNSDCNYLSVLYERYENGTSKINFVKQENLNKLDGLLDMPILKHQIQDGGFYITAGVTATKCPQTNTINLGIYRIQVIDKRKALIFMADTSDGYKNYEKYFNGNKSMPVSIYIGANMAYYFCGASKLPYSLDNYQIASKLLGRPVSLYDFEIPVPIEAQFIITGKVKNEKEWEAPFAEFKGYYCDKRLAPVLEVDEILCCNNPFYISIVAGKESGLTLSAMQGECLMYFYLKHRNFKVSSIKYRLEEAGEFVAIIETEEPCEEIIDKAFEFDNRLKFVICGSKVVDPWRELSIFPFRTVQKDYYYKGSVSGRKMGFIVEPRQQLTPVEIF